MRIVYNAPLPSSPGIMSEIEPRQLFYGLSQNQAIEKRSSLPSIQSATASTALSSSSMISASTSSAFSVSQASKTSSASSMLTDSAELSAEQTTLASSSSTYMPSITSSSSTSTSSSYTFKASVPTASAQNPYIARETLPLNSVFIVVAGVLGILALGVLLTWIIIWWNSRKRAKTDKEVQYHYPFSFPRGFDGSTAHLLSQSSQSSLLEKSSSSVYSKFSDPVSLGLDTTTPGHSYREMSNTVERRGSMTISPVLEMMRSSASNLDLPLFDPTQGLPQSTPHTPSVSKQKTAKTRPPSQVLDDMLAAIEFSVDYPEPRSNRA